MLLRAQPLPQNASPAAGLANQPRRSPHHVEWLAMGETDWTKQHHEDGSLAWKVVQVRLVFFLSASLAWPACVLTIGEPG